MSILSPSTHDKPLEYGSKPITNNPTMAGLCPNPSEKSTLPSHAYQEKRRGLGQKPGMIPIKGEPKSNTKNKKDRGETKEQRKKNERQREPERKRERQNLENQRKQTKTEAASTPSPSAYVSTTLLNSDRPV